ncbi:MAG: hypothetical protein H6742_03330 [Alphaproteobacteria bacterium]|nr:hypothetical protein [Alphaproteobacteria bacterium]
MKRLPGWVPVALLVLMTGLWAVDAWLGTGVFWAHDLRHHHMPWRVWAAGEWAAGRVPLWSPDVGSGFPLMADGQGGALYPPTMLLFLLLPAPLALNASVLLHHLWAALGAWLLGRALGLRDSAALVGAVAFGFSGFLATHTVYLGMQNAAAWLPWVLYATVAGRFGLVGLSTFMLATAGHPQAAAFSLLLSGATALWQRRPLPFALATGLGLLAASPQLLATLELTRLGLRDGGVDALFSNIGALPPQELLGGLLPAIFGQDTPAQVQETYFHRGTGYWGQGLNHWEMGFFLGVPAVVLAALSLSDRARRRDGWFWWAVVGLSAVLMLGAATPLWPLLHKLPGLSGFRFPVRFSLLLTMAVGVLSALGAQAVLDAPAERLRRLAIGSAAAGGLLWVGLSLGGVLLHLGEEPLRDALTGRFMAQVDPPPEPPVIAQHPLREVLFPGPDAEDPAAIPAKVDHIVSDLFRSTTPWSPRVLWPAGMLLAVGGLLALRDRVGPARTALLLSGLLYVDLWRFGAGYNGRFDRDFVDSQPEVLAAMPDDAGFPVRGTVVDRRIDPALDVQVLTSSLGLLHGTHDVILTSPLLVLRTEILLWAAGLDVGDKGPQKWDRALARPELLRLLGIRWLTSVHRVEDARLQAAGLRFVGAFADDRVFLYEVSDPRPPAWLSGCADVVASAEVDADPVAFVQRLDPDLPLVEDAPGLDLPACAGAPLPAGSATLVSASPTELVFDVRADRDALMVQRDTWYPGWVATVDGVDAPVLRTAFALRGVPVSAGSRTVTLRYAPRVLQGALLAGAAALLILGLWTALETRARGLGHARSWRRPADPGRS